MSAEAFYLAAGAAAWIADRLAKTLYAQAHRAPNAHVLPAAYYV